MRDTVRASCITPILVLLTIAFFILMQGCASVPKEAVQLSYTVGQDIQEFHKGYRNTVKAYFDEMRERGLRVINEEWKPIYFQVNFKESGLFERLRDTSISEEERYDILEYWCKGAIKDIDSVRTEFLSSLKVKEYSVIAAIDEAFNRAIRANATVTSHLHSVVKLKEVQDDILKSAGLLEIRNEINQKIADASDFTAEAISKIEVTIEKLEDSH